MNRWFFRESQEFVAALGRGEVVVLWQEVDGSVLDARETARVLCASLVVAVGASGLSVSRTGTGGLAGVAAWREGTVGLDAERGHPAASGDDVRTRALHADERGSAEAESDESFFGLWARKEAVLKALGVGLTLDPRLVVVGWPGVDWQQVESPSGERVAVRSIGAPGGAPAAISVGLDGGALGLPDCLPVLYERTVPGFIEPWAVNEHPRQGSNLRPPL